MSQRGSALLVFLTFPKICEYCGYKKNCDDTLMAEKRNFVWVQLTYIFFWNITVMEMKFCVCVRPHVLFVHRSKNGQCVSTCLPLVRCLGIEL
jgi:hypothetical protein